MSYGPNFPDLFRRSANYVDRILKGANPADLPVEPKLQVRIGAAALTLATDPGMRPLVAHCHLGFGKLHRRTGDRASALEHLSTAATMYREMEMGFWLEKAEEALKEAGQ